MTDNKQPSDPLQEIPKEDLERIKNDAVKAVFNYDFHASRRPTAELAYVMGAKAEYLRRKTASEPVLRDIISRAEVYLYDLNNDNIHDPSVGLYRDNHLVKLIEDIRELSSSPDKGEEVPGWISVNDRLPEYTERRKMWNDETNQAEPYGDPAFQIVLAYSEELGIFKAEYAKYNHWSEVSSISIKGSVKPTYWMPLPSPPITRQLYTFWDKRVISGKCEEINHRSPPHLSSDM